MLEITKLEEVHGNSVVVYSIKKLLERGSYPAFSIMSGHMGVGKSTVARLVAQELNKSEHDIVTFNFGLDIDMKELEDTVFKMNPAEPRAFVFEEMQGMDKAQQTALLTMLDRQPANVIIIGTTTESHKILRTIRSRATIWEFKLLSKKQLSQLLDDYLDQQGITNMSKQAKEALLYSAAGVPRDLLKKTDLAISGDFDSSQLNALLGRMSEDLIFSLFCSLKSQAVDFTSSITTFIEQANDSKLAQLRDFWTRYLLESMEIDNPTLPKDKLQQLSEVFTYDEAMKVGRTLIRATPDTIVMELVMLNMEMTRTSKANQIGQQKDKKAINTAQGLAEATGVDVAARKNAAKLDRTSMTTLTLNIGSKEG